MQRLLFLALAVVVFEALWPRPTLAQIGHTPAVHVYSASWCGACRQAKTYLTAHKVDFDDVDIESSRAHRDAFDALGGTSVPLVLVDEERMVGWSGEEFEARFRDAAKWRKGRWWQRLWMSVRGAPAAAPAG